jgi:hypothetical protein
MAASMGSPIARNVRIDRCVETGQIRVDPYMIFAVQNLDQTFHATGGNVLDRFVAEAERGYPCAEYIVVHRESSIVHGNSHIVACAGH